jgi:hypothetical protein
MPGRSKAISESLERTASATIRRRWPASQQRPFPALSFRRQFATLQLLLALIDEADRCAECRKADLGL